MQILLTAPDKILLTAQRKILLTANQEKVVTAYGKKCLPYRGKIIVPLTENRHADNGSACHIAAPALSGRDGAFREVTHLWNLLSSLNGGCRRITQALCRLSHGYGEPAEQVNHFLRAEELGVCVCRWRFAGWHDEAERDSRFVEEHECLPRLLAALSR